VPFYQLLLSILFTIFSGVGVWVASQREIEGVLKTQGFQQEQINELKANSSELKSSVRAIEIGVAEMGGDIKVIVSKLN
jgi:predicted membrane protein